MNERHATVTVWEPSIDWAPAQPLAYADMHVEGADTQTYRARTWTSPIVESAFPARELIPSWNAHTPPGSWLLVEGRVAEGSAWTPWFTFARWAEDDPLGESPVTRTTVPGQRFDVGAVDTDTLVAAPDHHFDRWQLRLTGLVLADTSRDASGDKTSHETKDAYADATDLTSDPTNDTGADTGADATDMTSDATNDATNDTGADTGADATETSSDNGTDVTSDTTNDTGADTGADTTDMTSDATNDTGADTGADATDVTNNTTDDSELPWPTVRLVAGAVSAFSIPDDAPASVAADGCGHELAVPRHSQRLHIDTFPEWDNGGQSWCSPTSTTMVLDHWGVGPTPEEAAWVGHDTDPAVVHGVRRVFDRAYQGAGNWAFNTAYAGARGLRAYVTRLRDLTEAERFVAAGIPLVVSVSFRADELDGAGYDTKGHLLTLVGFTRGGDVVSNDPNSQLAANNDRVRTIYRRDHFERVWLRQNGGLTYVMHPASVALPEPPAEANWR